MDALKFLEKPPKEIQPLYVVVGDEEFLKGQVLTALQPLILGDADPEFAWSKFPGDTVEWPAIRGELDTLPFLSPRRVVAIESADPFVTKYRQALEKYVGQPSKCGVLILEVKSWPANTKLAKMISAAATIVCNSQKVAALVGWCSTHAKAAHGKTLDRDAAAWLVELVGDEMGLLDQEIAKLAVYVGDAAEITRGDIDQLVGQSRAAQTFKIFEAIGAERPADALAILHQLFEQGEDEHRVLGAFTWQLTRLARLGRAVESGMSLAAACEAAGIIPWQRANFEQQARHLGRRRLGKLYDWLLDADFTMKSTGGLPGRLLLERLIVRMARPRVS
jgi:DNA polymerase-3 subunit delta